MKDKLIILSKKYKIPIIEDTAQAIGSKFNDRFAELLVKLDVSYPLVNALGDSGYLTTNSTKIANFIKDVRITE